MLSIVISIRVNLYVDFNVSYLELVTAKPEITVIYTTSGNASLGVTEQNLRAKRGMKGVRRVATQPGNMEVQTTRQLRFVASMTQTSMQIEASTNNFAAIFQSFAGRGKIESNSFQHHADRLIASTANTSTKIAIAIHGRRRARRCWIAAVIGVLSIVISIRVNLYVDFNVSYLE